MHVIQRGSSTQIERINRPISFCVVQSNEPTSCKGSNEDSSECCVRITTTLDEMHREVQTCLREGVLWV